MDYLLSTKSPIGPKVFEALVASGSRGTVLSERRAIVTDPSPADIALYTVSGMRISPVLFDGPLKEAIVAHNPKHVSSSAQGSRAMAAHAQRRNGLRHKQDASKELYAMGEHRAIVAGEPMNAEQIEALRASRNGYFCNVPLMGQMIGLHRLHFGQQTTEFTDLFLGHGGSLIAGYALGCTRVLGVEVDYGNLATSKANLETFLSRMGAKYKTSGGNDRHRYTIFRERGEAMSVELLRANSTRLVEQHFMESSMCGRDIISDIPWGCNACFAVGAEGVVRKEGDLDGFYRDLEQAIAQSGSRQITLARNSHAAFTLPEERSLHSLGPCTIAHYRAER